MLNFIKGLLIGIANIIPGVSGGTFALILRIYTRLINSISRINLRLIKTLFTGGAGEALKEADLIFLFQVLVGALAGIAIFTWPLGYFMNAFPGYTLSFFLGLIAASIHIPLNMIEDRKVSCFILGGAGFALVILLSLFSPSSAKEVSLLLIFFSGIIGISAMVLPGLSGSAVMLILGVYGLIIDNIREFTSSLSLSSFIFLSVFGLGCICGLVFFVRLMKLLLNKKKDGTLSFLTGMVLASLYFLWPFKDYPADSIDLSGGINRLPGSFGEAGMYFLFVILGIALSIGIERLGKKGSISREDN
ncbi:MAG: DUF368 domain-containing protein [Elusimicrobia bacterium]|nr:DUF368 domain-containing protein [Elusimicrobiota bacterium]